MENSTLGTLKGLLGDNAEEKIKSVLSSLSSTGDGIDIQNSDKNDVVTNKSPTLDNSSLDSIVQIKNMVDNLTNSSNDSRSALLLSLKPYMRSSRQSSIDTAVKILNISKLSGLLKL